MVSHFFEKGIDYDIESANGCISTIFTDFGRSVTTLSIIQVSDEELLRINQEFLRHDYLTDIITFDYSEGNSGIDGELYISHERVRENGGKKYRRELQRVIIHGCLHLCGLKDSTNNERKTMREKENIYLEKCSTWNS